MKTPVMVPLDVPTDSQSEYCRNYLTATHGTGRLMLFAGDQKVEHLNDDFHGAGISVDDGDPEHLFRIANEGNIGVFATHLGLIARYGRDHPAVPYLVKMNGKTNLIRKEEMDPLSRQWYGIDQVMDFREESGLSILGVGYTIYPGSTHEAVMFQEAAQIIYQAHQRGLITVLWIYPRGKSIRDERDPHLIAGAAGLGSSLGADFVKVNYPEKKGTVSAEAFREAVRAAGRTKVICAGGPATDPALFLTTLYEQIHVSGAWGNATGRNIHQRPYREAVRMCNSIFAITVEDATVDTAVVMLSR